MSRGDGDPWERRFVALFAALVVAVPPLVGELYPFSLPSMFSRAPRRLAHYSARGPDGARISLRRLHLHVVEWHDPPARGLGGVGYGRRRPPSAHVLGEIADLEAITRAVRWSLRRDPSLPSRVEVRQRVEARADHGGVEVVADHRWWVTREEP
jgi:hypothetical protein